MLMQAAHLWKVWCESDPQGRGLAIRHLQWQIKHRPALCGYTDVEFYQNT